jgi:molybdopterin synthase sulfur carrier subunit
MPTVWIPAQLRSLTGGQQTVAVGGRTVRQVIDELDRLYPGVKDRLCEGGGLRSGIAVAIDTRMASNGLLEEVGDNSEVHFLPAISGGAYSCLT